MFHLDCKTLVFKNAINSIWHEVDYFQHFSIGIKTSCPILQSIFKFNWRIQGGSHEGQDSPPSLWAKKNFKEDFKNEIYTKFFQIY